MSSFDKKADKSSLPAWAMLALVIISAAVIRGRLLNMPLERDEGEYAYIAQMMLKGVPPYLSAYSMKLPGIYAVYALIFVVFGQSCSSIHLGLLIFNAATIFVIFLLTRRLFGDLAAVIAAASYAAMSMINAVFGLAANAEHFVVLPVLLGIILLIQAAKQPKLWIVFIAALLFGLGFIIKQHGIFFAVFAAIYLLYSDLCDKPILWKRIIIRQFVFAIGAALPFAVTCFLFYKAGIFDKFWFWTFTYAGKYAASTTFDQAVKNFLMFFVPIVNKTILIWILSIFGGLMCLFNSGLRKHAPFIFGFTIFSFLCVCPGFYFREHYFIFVLPAAAIASGLGFRGFCDWVSRGEMGFRRSLTAVLAGLLIFGYSLLEQKKYLFQGDCAQVSSRTYWPNPFSQSLPIGKFIRENSNPDDTVAVLGSEPQIYFYSDRRSATRYIYVYPLMEVHDYAEQMQNEMIAQIEEAKPKFLVLARVDLSWLVQKNSKTTILKWTDSYIRNYYKMAGMIEIYPDMKTVYHWNEPAADYKPMTEYWVAVYIRNQ